MNWSALTKKQQYMAIGTVLIAVVQIFVLFYFLGGGSSSDKDAESSKLELEQLQNKLHDAQLVIGKTKKINTTLDETIAKLEELSVYTPTVSDRYAWAYEYISLRAAKAGVELDSLEEIFYAGDVEKDPVEQVYEISLSTQCGYNQLVELLWRIESGNPLVRIKTVDITTLSDISDQHRVRVALQWPATLRIERGSGAVAENE